MNVRFVSLGNPLDARYWSGIPRAMHDTLARCGCNVRLTTGLGDQVKYRYTVHKAYWRMSRREYLWSRTPSASRAFARAIDADLQPDDDVVFSPESMPVSLLRTDKPIVIWSDAVFDQMADYYPSRYFSRIPKCSLVDARRQERAALTRADYCVFSSRWAANAAAQYHGVPTERLAVIPFGPNFAVPPRVAVQESIARRAAAPPRLLFVGVEWERKGGPKALEVVRLLREAGGKAELVVIGAPGLDRASLPPWVIYHGFVDKNTDAGRRLVAEEFARAHFLILPTLADATPIVLAEASAWGVPSLTTKTGGVPEVITESANGLLFATEAPAAHYAARLGPFLMAPAAYHDFALAARAVYEERFDWASNVARLIGLFHTAVDQRMTAAPCSQPVRLHSRERPRLC